MYRIFPFGHTLASTVLSHHANLSPFPPLSSNITQSEFAEHSSFASFKFVAVMFWPGLHQKPGYLRYSPINKIQVNQNIFEIHFMYIKIDWGIFFYLNSILPPLGIPGPRRGHSVVQHGCPSSSLQQHSFMSRGFLQRHVSGMPIGARESKNI